MDNDSPWNKILSAAELVTYWADTAKLDPSFAKRSAEFYEACTAADLRALQHQAWNCCNPDSYQLARSYLALAA